MGLNPFETVRETVALSPRVEGYAVTRPGGRTVPVFGLDLLGDPTLARAAESEPVEFHMDELASDTSIWAGSGWGPKGRTSTTRAC